MVIDLGYLRYPGGWHTILADFNTKLTYQLHQKSIPSHFQAESFWLIQYNHSNYISEEAGKWPLYESEKPAHPLQA